MRRRGSRRHRSRWRRRARPRARARGAVRVSSAMKLAIAETEPLSSMSFPNSAPRRKIGKNCDTKCVAPPMKVCVQCASKGSRAKAAAIRAAAGASNKTLQPLYANQMRPQSETRMPTRPIASDPLEKDVKIKSSSGRRRRAHADQGRLAPTGDPRRAACRENPIRR